MPKRDRTKWVSSWILAQWIHDQHPANCDGYTRVNLRVKEGRHNTKWAMTVISGWTSGWRMESITPSEPWRLFRVNLRVKEGRHNTQWTMTVISGWNSGWRMEGTWFITPSELWRLYQGKPQGEENKQVHTVRNTSGNFGCTGVLYNNSNNNSKQSSMHRHV